MKQQNSINISFPRRDDPLFNEIHRVSALTYTPTAQLCRQLCREGLERRSDKQKMQPAFSR